MRQIVSKRYSAGETTLTCEEAEALTALVAIQREILPLPIEETWQLGRIKAVAAALSGCLKANSDLAGLSG
jgi:two-component system, chemotaxis family, sensor kinase CheA